MTKMRLCGALVGAWLMLSVAGLAQSTTTVSDTVYYADGSPAQGSLLISWPQFTTMSGAAIAAGSTTVTLSSGGGLSVALAPNAGSNPIGSYYTVLYHLSDGSVSRENWVVPVSGSPVQLTAVRSTVMPLSVAMQTVSKAYVDRVAAGIPVGATASTLGTVKLATGQTSTTLATVATTGSASDIATGTLADGRLSSNIPLLSAGNNFAYGLTQTMSNWVARGSSSTDGKGTFNSIAGQQYFDLYGATTSVMGILHFRLFSSDLSEETDPLLLQFNGAYFYVPINSGGIYDSGNIMTTGRIQPQQSTPGSSSATCTAGQIWTDASYIYVCTATNTIKRAAISSF